MQPNGYLQKEYAYISNKPIIQKIEHIGGTEHPKSLVSNT
jgi:hypothetical protein